MLWTSLHINPHIKELKEGNHSAQTEASIPQTHEEPDPSNCNKNKLKADPYPVKPSFDYSLMQDPETGDPLKWTYSPYLQKL